MALLALLLLGLLLGDEVPDGLQHQVHQALVLVLLALLLVLGEHGDRDDALGLGVRRTVTADDSAVVGLVDRADVPALIRGVLGHRQPVEGVDVELLAADLDEGGHGEVQEDPVLLLHLGRGREGPDDLVAELGLALTVEDDLRAVLLVDERELDGGLGGLGVLGHGRISW